MLNKLFWAPGINEWIVGEGGRTQDSEAEHTTSRSRRVPTILNLLDSTPGLQYPNLVPWIKNHSATECATATSKHKTFNSSRLTNAGLMLGQRRRRWASIKPTLCQHLGLAHTEHRVIGSQSPQEK